MVDVATGKPEPIRKKLVSTGAGVVSDYAPYWSHATKQWIDGKRARREEMARGGFRELDPSEIKDVGRRTDEFKREQAELAKDSNVQYVRSW